MYNYMVCLMLFYDILLAEKGKSFQTRTKLMGKVCLVIFNISIYNLVMEIFK